MENTIISPNVKVIFQIYPPYSKKDEVKNAGATWLSAKKYWYILNKDNELYELYKRVELNVNYNKKDFVKENEVIWDKENKTWFTYQSNTKLIDFYK